MASTGPQVKYMAFGEPYSSRHGVYRGPKGVNLKVFDHIHDHSSQYVETGCKKKLIYAPGPFEIGRLGTKFIFIKGAQEGQKLSKLSPILSISKQYKTLFSSIFVRIILV